MAGLDHLLERNRRWAERVRTANADFFNNLSREQHPNYLWIGCSDARVPANEIVDLEPGELFVHRNIANVIVHSDMNGMSVLQYAIEVLGVQHVIVCGHYGCGGVQAAMGHAQLGLIDNWLRHIKDVYLAHGAELDAIADETQRLNRFCELNTLAQAANVARTPIVQNAWARGQSVQVHAWLYCLSDGLIRDLDVSLSGEAHLAAIHRMAAPTSGGRER